MVFRRNLKGVFSVPSCFLANSPSKLHSTSSSSSSSVRGKEASFNSARLSFRVIRQIQKARKALIKSHEKYPEEDEIAKMTGLSLSKIRNLSQICQYRTRKKTVMRQHMKEDLHDLLTGLEKRERQVMVLRYGLKGTPSKSLEKIGRLLHVNKEGIRRIEMKAMTKLRDKETCRILSHYLDL